MDNLPKSTILLSGYKIICEPGTHIIKDIVWDGIKCPFKDPNCIADHDGGDKYCISATTGLAETVIPEAPEGVGAAVISPGTLTTPETPKTAVEANDTITFARHHGFQVGDEVDLTTETSKQRVQITALLGETQVTYTVMTPEKYMKRWTDSWLEGIDYKKSTKPMTGRRQFRNNRAGDGKVRKLPRVRGCGHALDLKKQPRHRNCKSCWTAFFRNQDAMAENIAKIIVEQGQYRVAETFGIKFLKRFHEYCILVERVEALRKAYEEEQNAIRELAGELTIEHAEDSVQSVGSDAETSIEVG